MSYETAKPESVLFPEVKVKDIFYEKANYELRAQAYLSTRDLDVESAWKFFYENYLRRMISGIRYNQIIDHTSLSPGAARILDKLGRVNNGKITFHFAYDWGPVNEWQSNQPKAIDVFIEEFDNFRKGTGLSPSEAIAWYFFWKKKYGTKDGVYVKQAWKDFLESGGADPKRIKETLEETHKLLRYFSE